MKGSVTPDGFRNRERASMWRKSLPFADISAANPAVSAPEDISYAITTAKNGGAWSNPFNSGIILAGMSTQDGTWGSTPERLLDRTSAVNRTQDVPGGFIYYDFNPSCDGTWVCPTHFFFGHGWFDGNHRARSLFIQGGNGNSFGSATWTNLLTISNNSAFLPNFGYSYSAATQIPNMDPSVDRYRFLRVSQFSTTTTGDNFLCCHEVFWGGYYSIGG